MQALAAAAVLVFASSPTRVHAADATLPRLVQLLGASDDSQLQLDVLRGMAQAMSGRAQAPMPDGWQSAEKTLSQSDNSEIRSLTQSLGLKFGSPAALASLKGSLKNRQADATERENALKSLLSVRDPELPTIVQGLLDDPVIRAEGIRALASYNNENTPSAILKAFPSLDATEQRDAVNTLASRASYAGQLMAAVEKSIVPKQALTADLLRQLRSFKSQEINAAIERVYGTFRESSEDKKQQIAKFRGVYYAGGSTPGDASRGRVVYDRICAQCHTLFDVGGKVGPDLTGSNRSDLDYILENMVDPNAVIPNEYRGSSIEMSDERLITGIVKKQDQNSVTVATANDTLVLPREDIVSLDQSELSMMPEGLLDTLKDQEVRDLIYYLRQPAQAKLPSE